MSGPAVSVLMTAYNREAYIGAAIESVLAQDFEDFELLVTDNQSTDGTVAIARAYEARDARVRVVVNERNLGQFGNRNRAASLARGRFLKYHDSDDLMYPYGLGLLVELLAAEPRAAFALSTGWEWPGGPVPMLLTPRQCYEREFLGFGLFMAGPGSALFRADAFRRLGGFPEAGAPSDHLFWLRACRTEHVLLAPADLYWYRLHPSQELQSEGARREYALVAGEVWRALAAPGCPIDGEALEAARRSHAWTVAKHTWRDLRAGRGGLAWLRLSTCGLRMGDWLRYLRRPVRSVLAGVPLGPDGTPQTPGWARLRATGVTQ